jgi:flagellum-specific peptidoglycan hydrolase FlgJ
MQLKTIQNKIKHTQLDVSMNLTKQPIFVPVWFLVALLGVVMSGFITNHKIKNAKEKAEKLLVEFEKTEQPKTKQINISNKIEHTLGYFEYTIDGYSYVEKIKPYNERLFIVENLLKQESKLTIKARQAAEQELKKIGLMINDRDIIRQQVRIRQHTRNDLKKLVPQEMIDSFAPPIEFKQEKRTSFNTEAMQTAKPKAVSGSLARSFDEPLQEKTKQQKDDENRAQSFSNLGFVMNPTYAKRHKIKPSVVAVKTKILNDYLEEFGDVAIKEMHDYGIPASITLAQGLLESNAGDSRLAVDANNHFGIKCFSKSCKKGHCKNYTDDTHKDFFRVYKNVWESYRAHSLFLQRDRYKHLLKLKKTDYKGWAHGLKKAGYATDKRYAYKLINIIEALKLYEYDKK